MVIFLEFKFDDISRVKNITFISNMTKETMKLADGYDRVVINKFGQLPQEMKQILITLPVTDKFNDVMYNIVFSQF